NGGKLLSPYIPRKAEEKVMPRVRRQINVDQRTLQEMVPGMIGSVNYGSGRRAFDPVETIAGKTGTCVDQNGWVGLFTSYAPLSDPKLAVAVIARGTDAHGHVAAAIAGRIYRELNGRFGVTTNLQIAKSTGTNPANI